MDVNNAMLNVDLYNNPNGSKEFPARTCKELKQSHPSLKTGESY